MMAPFLSRFRGRPPLTVHSSFWQRRRPRMVLPILSSTSFHGPHGPKQFFFMRSLLDTQQARTRNQPHATPEGALDTTREQALTETGVPQPAVTRAAHNAAGPPRGALYSDTDREVWLTAGHTTGHTHATARRNATDGGTRLTASPTDSSDWRPAQRSVLRTPAALPAYRPQPSRASS